MKTRQHVTELNGTWKFMLDRDDSGGEKGYMNFSCDTSLWRETEIPGTFETAAQECTGYRGTVWFRRSFTAEETAGALLWLEFGAVNYRADVWINERPVGTAIGDYLPFRFEVSEAVVPGENLLCVRVNNRLIPGMLPPSHFWRGHGGIIRGVSLYPSPRCYLDSVRALKEGDGLKITAKVVNASEEEKAVRLSHFCPENGLAADDVLTVPANAEAVSEIRFPVGAFRLWSPDDPAVYTCETSLDLGEEKDFCSVTFGVRDLEAKDGRIFLNGKEVRLRGFNRHEDSPVRMLATDAENSERDFTVMKRMGANFVRFCHYPHSEIELDLCDRLGLLVLAELPLNAPMVAIREYDAAETERALPQTYIRAREAARKLIDRDYNHPSIILWSVSNESNESVPQLRRMNDALMQYVKKLDPSRFATHVSQGGWWDNPEIAGFLFAEDDVICVNAYVTMEHTNRRSEGDSSVSEEDYLHAAAFWDARMPFFREKYPGKPIVVTEFGYPTGKISDGIRDEDKQADVILCDLISMEGRVAGCSIWHFTDHEWEIAENGGVFYGSRYSPYGLFTRDRKPKKAAAVVEEYWNDHK